MLSNLLEAAGGSIPIGRQPHISIDGRQFNAVFGGEKRSVADWDAERGAMYMEFIVVGASKNLFKIMYSAVYDPANPSPPVCWSSNGQGPADDVAQPQAAFCSECEWNKWGSAVTDNGTSVKRCTDKKRIVVVTPRLGATRPLQFDIPPASFKSWVGFLKMLRDGRISNLENVIVRVYFEANDNGVLSYHPGGYVDQRYGPQELVNVQTTAGTQEVLELTGALERPMDPSRFIPHMANTPQQRVAAPQTMNLTHQHQGGQPAVTYQGGGEMTGRDYVQQAQYQREPAPQYQQQAPAPQYQQQAPAPQYQQQAPAPQQPQYQQQQAGGMGNGYNGTGGGMGGGGGHAGGGSGGGYAVGGVSGGMGPQGAGGAAGGGYSGAPQHGGMGGAHGGGAAVSGGASGGGYQAPGQQSQAALPPPQADAPKRTRRTKAEMEAARQAASGSAPQPETSPAAGAMGQHGMAPVTGATSALRNQLNNILEIDVPE